MAQSATEEMFFLTWTSPMIPMAKIAISGSSNCSMLTRFTTISFVDFFKFCFDASHFFTNLHTLHALFPWLIDGWITIESLTAYHFVLFQLFTLSLFTLMKKILSNSHVMLLHCSIHFHSSCLFRWFFLDPAIHTHTHDLWWLMRWKKSALNRWIKAPKWLLIEFTTTWNHHFRPEEKYKLSYINYICVFDARDDVENAVSLSQTRAKSSCTIDYSFVSVTDLCMMEKLRFFSSNVNSDLITRKTD